MKKRNKDLDFFHEVAKCISERTEKGCPLSTEDVFDLFKNTYENMTEAKIVEEPIFMPFIIEREDDIFIARCHAFHLCRGFGNSEEEAIQKLKMEIDLYNKSCIDTEKRMRMKEMVSRIFPKDFF